ncbi:MAG: GH116 family glycosyl hydrolase [Clostridia bacterium]
MVNGLRNSGLPLGGIGTGSVELRSDGYFYDWQIMNNRPWGAGPSVELPTETSYFGFHASLGAEDWSGILGLPKDYNRFLNDPYEMPWATYPKDIEPVIRMPHTQLNYIFAELPLEIRLESFSPFIPLDAKNSGLPIAYFTFYVKNNASDKVKFSLFQSLRNLAAYADKENPSVIQFDHNSECASLQFSREKASPFKSTQGNMTIGVMNHAQQNVSWLTHPRNRREIWECLRATGDLENKDYGRKAETMGNVGDSWMHDARLQDPSGLLCSRVEINAGEEQRITFVMTWNFPDMEENEYITKKKPNRCIGHQYALWFDGASEVLSYGVKNFAHLKKETFDFAEEYYRSSYPQWLLEAVFAQMAVLIKASWWDKTGRFGVWEGLGCCGLQTTDVTYYASFAIAHLFPEIQMSSMRLTKSNIETKGKIPHLMPGNFSCCNQDERNRIDLIPEFILLVWRDYRWTGNTDYVKEMWPTILSALEYYKQLDTDGDGLPNNTGPDQTYDQFPLKGTSSFVGFIYAASLHAASELAECINDFEMADVLKSQHKVSVLKLEEQLWNGSYYRLSNDLTTNEKNEGVMVDQISGEWYTRQVTGNGFLPDEKVASSLSQILEYCSNKQGYVSNCAWPAGDEVVIGKHTADQANWPWSGVEFAFASFLILSGKREEGIQVAQNVWNRYERAGHRFNHSECGQHYYRPLSAWTIYLSLTGFILDVPSETVTIDARENGRFLILLPNGWGTVKIQEEEVTIEAMRGTLAWNGLQLKMTDGNRKLEGPVSLLVGECFKHKR